MGSRKQQVAWLALAMWCGIAAVVGAQGFVCSSDEELSKFPRVSGLGLLGAGGQGSADLSSYMPPVGNQGSNYSCVAWATTYYLKAYHENREHGWDPAASAHRFSPMFVYNQVNNGRDAGISFAGAFSVLKPKGCAPLSVFNILSGDYRTWPDIAQCEAAMPYRADAAAVIFGIGGAGDWALSQMKALLDRGEPSVIGVDVYTDFYPASPDYFYDGPSPTATYRGAHALTVCGYDDAKCGQGGLKVVNSWGTGWGNRGYGWISYDFFREHAIEGWSMTDKIGYQPQSWARVEIQHSRRNDLMVGVGVGSPTAPRWEGGICGCQGGALADVRQALDVTDALSYLPPSSTNRWYVRIKDFNAGQTGTLERFSILYGGREYFSADAPLAIPDTKTWVYGYLDGGGAPANHPPTRPTVSISPTSPKTTDDLVASASGSTDADGDTITYKYAWYKDTVLQSSLTINTVTADQTAKNQVWKCVVTPNDGHEDGPAGEAQATIANTVPTAPTVSISPTSPKTTDDLVASASGSTDADGNTITYKYAWYKDTVLQTSLTTNTVTADKTAKKQVWKCVVTPNDGQDDGATGEAQKTIANTVPTAPKVTLSPSSPKTTDNLVVTASGSTDADGDTVTYKYAWYRDTVLQTSLTTNAVTEDLTAKGQVWKCTVRAYDGTGNSAAVSKQVTIGNTLPSAPTVSISPGAPDTSSDLVATAAATDADGDTLTYTYAWSKEGVLQDGLTTGTVTADLTARSEVWTCAVTASDDTGAGAAGEAQVTIGNAKPTAPTVSISPSSPKTTSNLVATPSASTDADGDPVTYRYAWYKDSVLQGDLTRNTVTHDKTAKRQVWKCVVTPNDGQDDGATGEGQKTIANTVPTAPTVSISPSNPKTADNLVVTASGSTDADGDTITYSYAWYKDSVLQRGLTTDTVTADLTAKGEVWKCAVKAYDGTGNSAAVSKQVAIENTLPDAPAVSISPAAPGDDDALVATATAADADGDVPTYAYAWYKDGALRGDLTTDGVPADRTAVGEQWRCVATPNDGTGDGASGDAQVTIRGENEAPTAPTVAISPGSPQTADGLVATASGSSDPEGAPITYRYAWYRDGVLQGALTTNTVSADLTAKGETWRCVATPNDGHGEGPSGEAQVVIRNTSPVLSSMVITPDMPTADDDLAAVATATDADGDSIVYRYAWYQDGVLQNDLTTDTVPAARTAAGQLWRCVVTPDDHTDCGPTLEASVSIGDAPPPLTVLSVQPKAPTSADPLVATAKPVTDPEGGAVRYGFRWLLDGVEKRCSVGAAPTDTLPAGLTRRGQTWVCVVRVSDGENTSAAVEAKVKVGNGVPTAPTLTLGPTAPTAAQNIRIGVSGSTDADGDTVYYAYRWFRWDAAQRAWVEKQSTNTAKTSDTLAAALTAKGEQWKCSVRSGDGLGVSRWTEVRFRIGNTPPPSPRLSLSATAPRSIDDVVASVQAVTDADGDKVQYGFRWLLGGRTRRLTASTKPSDTLSASYTRKGQVWVCQAWAGDGTTVSRTVEQEFTIGNSPPPAPSTRLSSATPGAGQTVTVRVAPVTDPDGNAVVYGYRWLLNGVVKRTKVTSATSDTLPSGATRQGQVWTLIVRAGDSQSSGEATQVEFHVGGTATVYGAALTCVSALSAVPTAAGAEVTFTLSAPASVQAEVLNIAGRPVRLITPGTPFESGLQSLVWTGQSDAGLPVPNGRYLIRVTARGADGTSSQALGTVLVQR